jgi:mevalonate kinase
MLAYASGCVVLVGDFADLCDGGAVVVPLEQGVAARLTPSDVLQAHAGQDGAESSWFDGEEGPLAFVGALATIAAAWGRARGGHLQLDGGLPLEAHAASLAPRAVAVARATLASTGVTLEDDALAAVAREALARTGTLRAGVECAGAALGTTAWVRMDGGVARAEAIDCRIHVTVARLPAGGAAAVGEPAGSVRLARVHAGEGARLRDVLAVQRTASVRTALETQSAVAAAVRRALLAGDAVKVGEALDRAQAILESELCAAVPELADPGANRTVRALRRAGALGARALATLPGGIVAVWRNADEAREGAARIDAMGLTLL